LSTILEPVQFNTKIIELPDFLPAAQQASFQGSGLSMQKTPLDLCLKAQPKKSGL